ncbi:hypothetical protein M422DRAFT_38815 [Sphaerobolus stellatus SS14]|uniref:Transcriptional coactivator p15 (PC4) C-terminal domain-containing protein n=1 Tax=Sphaerobolus stellatus (strain SS14) TaxID=990650 RepID=A0A0C9U8F6_SPHS4|nr:hypothetical protein M422DRAFT_38815 [Sphaerobolus stellatus SS14]
MPKREAESSDEEVQSKKVKTSDDSQVAIQLQKDDEGNYYVDLGSMKRATVSQFKGKANLNIREYYTDKPSGQLRPGKKGITLNVTQWETLLSVTNSLTEKLKEVDSGTSSKVVEKKEAKKEKPKAKKSDGKMPAKKKKAESSEEDEDE